MGTYKFVGDWENLGILWVMLLHRNGKTMDWSQWIHLEELLKVIQSNESMGFYLIHTNNFGKMEVAKAYQ